MREDKITKLNKLIKWKKWIKNKYKYQIDKLDRKDRDVENSPIIKKVNIEIMGSTIEE